MENRDIGHEDRNEPALKQHAAAVRRASIDEPGEGLLGGEEVSLLIEFFRLLDRWERQEVVQ